MNGANHQTKGEALDLLARLHSLAKGLGESEILGQLDDERRSRFAVLKLWGQTLYATNLLDELGSPGAGAILDAILQSWRQAPPGLRQEVERHPLDPKTVAELDQVEAALQDRYGGRQDVQAGEAGVPAPVYQAVMARSSAFLAEADRRGEEGMTPLGHVALYLSEIIRYAQGHRLAVGLPLVQLYSEFLQYHPRGDLFTAATGGVR